MSRSVIYETLDNCISYWKLCLRCDPKVLTEAPKTNHCLARALSFQLIYSSYSLQISFNVRADKIYLQCFSKYLVCSVLVCTPFHCALLEVVCNVSAA